MIHKTTVFGFLCYILKMDDASPSTEGSETQLSSDHSDGADDEWRLQLEKAIADDFSSYDCFMQPFYSLDEKDKNKKELDGVDEKQTDTVDACLQVRLLGTLAHPLSVFINLYLQYSLQYSTRISSFSFSRVNTTRSLFTFISLAR